MKPIYFDEAPDIFSSIYDVDPSINYRQLNKRVYNQTALSFYERNCNKPITLDEIVNYINSKPDKIAFIEPLLKYTDDTETAIELYFRNFYKGKIVDKYIKETFIIQTIVNENEFFTINDSYINGYDILENFTLDKTYDLYTLYNIYKNRINCMRVNKNYAKEKIMSIYKDKVDVDDSFLNIYYVYLYLVLNCSVFDIPVNYIKINKIDLIPQPFNVDMSRDEASDFLYDILDRPENKELHNQEKQKMLSEINKLTKLLNHNIQQL